MYYVCVDTPRSAEQRAGRVCRSDRVPAGAGVVTAKNAEKAF